MTPVGGYESSWKHTKSQRFQLSSTRSIILLAGRTQSPNVRTKSTTFSLFVKTCATFLMLAQSVGNSNRFGSPGCESVFKIFGTPKKKMLKNVRQRLMQLDYAILQSDEGRDELARRALKILKSKPDDKTSYEVIADALIYT